MEFRARNDSVSSDVFTRNPNDRYRTPVPPKPLPSPRLGDLCKEPYSVPMHSLNTPRSATYPMPTRLLSPGFERSTRSASTSPGLVSGTVFSDLKSLRDMVTSAKHSTSHGRSRVIPNNVRELRIGTPVLISTTAEDINLIPLPSTPLPCDTSPFLDPVSAKLREFSPLGSHPIDPAKDLDFSLPNFVEEQQPKRPHSQSQVLNTPDIKVTAGRGRANSVDTRRTRHYCLFPNEPWISSPRFPSGTSMESEPAPVLKRPSLTPETPLDSLDERPRSRHGGDQSLRLRKTTFDKELPALPRYLVPAPLFACHSAAPSPMLPEEDEEQVEDAQKESPTPEPKASHFSTWSTDSTSFSYPISEQGTVHSPTYSSLTSNSSDAGSPQRYDEDLEHDDMPYKHDSHHGTKAAAVDNEDEGPALETSYEHQAPPRLQLPFLDQDVFQLNLLQPDAKSRRQVSCFGLSGFQGYSLPEDETMSQATITKNSLPPAPTVRSERDSSVSQLENLMSEFGFLGDVVH